MLLPVSIQKAVSQETGSAIAEVVPLSGGDSNTAYRLTFANGLQRVLKCRSDSPEHLFTAEATGLQALVQTRAIRVPAVFLARRDCLLIEYVPTAKKSGSFWTLLGQQLAKLHQQSEWAFGFSGDNYCGLTPQPNPWTVDGHTFFAEQRLLYQGQLAYDRRLLGRRDMANIQALCKKLPDLVPVQPPSLLHGDLWSGNLLCSATGEPVLIDPAAHYGWAEAELAMTALFGGFDEVFYDAYLETRQLEAGWRQRLPIYNLYHLLNHLNLFGSVYLTQVAATLRRFS